MHAQLWLSIGSCSFLIIVLGFGHMRNNMSGLSQWRGSASCLVHSGAHCLAALRT